ncbi:hypothetical protein [Streptomyces caatingaensis]|uniref:Uncharacterized protein n=1 Tax=Streptomyces caatingaensis TaxID=1678637 RepID=A0A0K9XKJ9_9ACTN|nr:hypothetical protein [Streptomyces caatingaensis]KNB53626.1 hypothetical protein AC230_03080 [Streptomyces caatingaensis]
MTGKPDDPGGPWRPHYDEPLLTPAMAGGYDAVPATELDRLRCYLEELVAARRAPVHVAVAFNAAYFGYDLTGEGYGAGALDLDAFPVVTFGETAPALPVGAMVHIATGSQPLYAEIVYKEGRHPATSALGDVPAWVSGAPVGASGPGLPNCDPPTRRELLVPDPCAFGPGLSLSAVQLNRLRDHARWIDRHGHVLVDAVHLSREAAGVDELTAYADHLMTTARQQLFSPLLPAPLTELAGGQGEDLLHGTLLCLLDVVRHVLESSDALRMWGPYAMRLEDLAACWRDQGPLGGDDMGALASALRRAAQPVAKRRYGMLSPVTVYTAVGPRLYDFPGAEPLLTGTGYAMAVCRANVALADVLRGESENGLFDNGTRVTLDDAFEGGGVWRSCHPGGGEPTDDPLAAAGLGWRTAIQPAKVFEGPAAASAETEREPTSPTPAATGSATTALVDGPLDESGLAAGQLLRISDSEVAWKMPLRLSHIMDGFLPLRVVIADELRDLTRGKLPIRLELAHPGGELDESEAVQDTLFDAEGPAEAGRLSGVEWPLDFFPGLELRLQWPRGGRVVRATTVPLEVPVMVDGRVIGHRYEAAILTRENAPGSTRSGDSAAGLTPCELVMRAVRRCGRLTPDGHALLDREGLPTVVHGPSPGASQVTALEAAIHELLAHGRLYAATGSRDAEGVPHYPARDDESRIPLIGYDPDPVPAARTGAARDLPGRATQQAAPLHYVFGHLRRLRPGHTPSDQQRAAFREHCRRFGKADGWDLPRGYTFVTQYTRGH